MDTSKCKLCSCDKKWEDVQLGEVCSHTLNATVSVTLGGGGNATLINLRTKADLNQPLNLAHSPPSTQFKVLSCWGFIRESLPEGTGKKGREDPKPTAVGIQGKPEARSGTR